MGPNVRKSEWISVTSFSWTFLQEFQHDKKYILSLTSPELVKKSLETSTISPLSPPQSRKLNQKLVTGLGMEYLGAEGGYTMAPDQCE